MESLDMILESGSQDGDGGQFVLLSVKKISGNYSLAVSEAGFLR